MNNDFLKQLNEKIKNDTKNSYNKTVPDKIQESKTCDPVEFEKQHKDFVKVGNLFVRLFDDEN